MSTFRSSLLSVVLTVVAMHVCTERASASDVERARRLHDELIIVDGHVHMITSVFHLGIDPWKVQTTGTFDYARAREGGLDVVVEQLYTEDAYNNYNYTIKQTLRLIETFYRVLEANQDKMALALDTEDIRRIVADGKLAVVLALEGGMDMEGDLDILRLYHRLGVRMVQLTSHSTTNALADSAYDVHRWGGISEQGLAVIREMNRLGMIIDISHASDEAKVAIVAASKAPVVTSHNGLQRFSALPGNLTDDHVRTLADKEGLIGLHSAGWFLSQASLDWGFHEPRTAQPPAWESQFEVTLTREPLDYGDYIKKLDELMTEKWLLHYGYGEDWRKRQLAAERKGAPLVTVADWVDEIEYVDRLVGADHISVGLDLMSGGNWLKDFDAASYPLITRELVSRGFRDETVGKIMGENWLRILDAAKVP